MIPYFVLFDDNYLLEKSKKNRLFLNPIFVHSIYTLQDAESFLQKVHDASKNNYVALALSYEFGYAFESKLRELLLHECPSTTSSSSSKRSLDVHLQKKSLPKKAIATFAVFDKVFRIDNEEVELFLEGLKTSSSEKEIEAKITQSLDEKKYSKKFAEIKKALVAGETYQVNFTFKKNYQLNDFCDLAWLYSKLRQAQPVPYGAFFHLPECTLMSRSPELFLKREGEKLMTRPMKGTLVKNDFLKNDFSKKNIGKSDWKKLRAENLIIVDLLRNDLSKVAQKGTVNVKAFLDREKYKTIDQLTSTITCELNKNTSLAKILTATFPCGSVTGAPKIKTMECIKKLEREPRSFYCGALGFVQPREKKTSSDFLFNVAIRTLIINALDLQTKSFTFGVGSGVIVDSKSQEEYFESCLKSVFLDKIFDKESKQKSGSKKQSDWQEEEQEEYLLFETMLAVFEDGWRIKNLEGHLSRLKRSADALNFSVFVSKIERQIHNALKKLKTTLPNDSQPSGNQLLRTRGSGGSRLCKKIKLLLDRFGKSFLRIEDFDKASTTENRKPRICLSAIKLNSGNALLRHKTTLRKLYESQFFLYGKLQGFADVIFFNEKDQLCEGSRHNIFLVKNGRWQTPSLVCGLLPGLMREQTIKSKEATEKILYAKDLYDADQIYLTNSLRGCYEVVLK